MQCIFAWSSATYHSKITAAVDSLQEIFAGFFKL